MNRQELHDAMKSTRDAQYKMQAIVNNMETRARSIALLLLVDEYKNMLSNGKPVVGLSDGTPVHLRLKDDRVGVYKNEDDFEHWFMFRPSDGCDCKAGEHLKMLQRDIEMLERQERAAAKVKK